MRVLFALPLLASLFLGVGCQDPPTEFGAEADQRIPESLSGAYSRLVPVDDRLYAVDQTSLITFDIADVDQPVEVDRQEVGRTIETLYHHAGNLFVGSRTGMFTYSIEEGLPRRRGEFNYSNLPFEVEPCDPVVANSTTAYATLYTSDDITDECGRIRSVQTLVAMDVTDLNDPKLIRTYDVLTPRGLSLENDLLFVCNDHNGVTVFDVADPQHVTELSRVSDVQAFDAIAKDGVLTVVGATELVQFDYSDPSNLVELEHLPYPKA